MLHDGFLTYKCISEEKMESSSKGCKRKSDIPDIVLESQVQEEKKAKLENTKEE